MALQQNFFLPQEKSRKVTLYLRIYVCFALSFYHYKLNLLWLTNNGFHYPLTDRNLKYAVVFLLMTGSSLLKQIKK